MEKEAKKTEKDDEEEEKKIGNKKRWRKWFLFERICHADYLYFPFSKFTKLILPLWIFKLVKVEKRNQIRRGKRNSQYIQRIKSIEIFQQDEKSEARTFKEDSWFEHIKLKYEKKELHNSQESIHCSQRNQWEQRDWKKILLQANRFPFRMCFFRAANEVFEQSIILHTHFTFYKSVRTFSFSPKERLQTI